MLSPLDLSEAAKRVRPASALLVFAATFFVFHQIPSFAGEPAGDVIDLLTPFAVVAASTLVLAGLDVRGWTLIAALAAAVLYVDGHGIHLAANSIANEGPGPEVSDLVHFWDESFSHIESVLGWYGLAACVCLAEGEARGAVGAGTGGGSESGVVLAGVTSILLGWAFFTAAVEGGTWPILLAVTPIFGFWAVRQRRPLLTTVAAAYALATVLLGVWAVWQGGVPQFSEAGLL